MSEFWASLAILCVFLGIASVTFARSAKTFLAKSLGLLALIASLSGMVGASYQMVLIIFQ